VLPVDGDVDLPAGTTARLQQTSLLGEKYVALVRPDRPAGGELEDGDHLGDEATSQSAQVEQVLGALSLVLNGGGVGQFQEISRELQQAGDDPERVQAFLDEMATFTSGLDDRKESVTAAIDSLAALSRTLEGDQQKIARALDGLEPGLASLADQREDLTAMLAALDRLSDVTVQTLDKAQADVVADLELLAPVLQQLGAAGSDLPRSLQILLTYPFPDSVLDAVKGDYLNVFLTTRFRTQPAGCTDVSCDWPQVAATAGRVQSRYVPPVEDEDDGQARVAPSPVRPTPSASASPSPSASPRPSPSTSPTPSATPASPAPTSPTTPATDEPKEQD
jgi:phospholipid/cholesterol/gamma-HCH transport system substrate-binding protein